MSALTIVSSTLVANQPRYWEGLGLTWPESTLLIAERILDQLHAHGHLVNDPDTEQRAQRNAPALIDFPDQACEVCSVSHPGLPCPQPDLFGEAS